MAQENENLFQKKEVIFSETLGVCRVEEVTKLTAGNAEPVLYYALRSIADKEKVSYIPVEKHTVLLRKLIEYKQAEILKQSEQFAQLPETQKQEINYVLTNMDISEK